MAPTPKLSEFVVSSFPPRAVVFADADVENIVQKKFNIASFHKLLMPFSRFDSAANVQIVDLNSSYVNLPIFTLDIVSPEALKATADAGVSVESMQIFRRRLNAIVSDHFEKAAASDRDISASADLVKTREHHEKIVGSCFELFAVDFIRNLPLYELQYLRCCLAAVYVVASHTPDALKQLMTLSESSVKSGISSVHWLSSSIYKFFVLVHDTNNIPGVKREFADSIFQHMKSTFGGANVHLCVLNTTNVVAGAGNDTSAVFDGQLNTISGNIVPLSPSQQQSNNFTSDSSIDGVTGSNKLLAERQPTPVPSQLSAQDAEAIKVLLRNFVRDGLVPYAERQIRAYHQNVTVSRRSQVTRSLFSGATKLFGGPASSSGSSSGNPASNHFRSRPSSGVAPVTITPFPDDSVQAQTRRCADVAFLFRQYDLAAQLYHSLRRDALKQQQAAATGTTVAASAWLHYAAASEMCALSTYLSKPADSYAGGSGATDAAAVDALPFVSYFKDALTQYSNFAGGDDRLLVRCGILYAQVLLELENYEAAANVYVKLANENEPSLMGALMLEQASICFHRQLMHRKYAFFIVLAGFRFAKAGLRRPALQCFKQALAAYGAVGLRGQQVVLPDNSWHRGWHFIAERVYFLMARQCMQSNDYAAALQHLSAVIEIYKQQSTHRVKVVDTSDMDSVSGTKASKTMHSLALIEYGMCQVRVQQQAAAEKRSETSLLLVHDQSVQVFFYPYSCDSSFKVANEADDDEKMWKIPDEDVAVRTSAEKSVMEYFALSHNQQQYRQQRQSAPAKSTVFYCGAATENKTEPQPYCGDPVLISIRLSNPFAVAVELTEIMLLYTFAEQKSVAESVDADSVVLSVQDVDANVIDGFLPALTGGLFTDKRAIILQPYVERHSVLFRITPRKEGYVNVVGIRYLLRIAVTSTTSIANDSGMIAQQTASPTAVSPPEISFSSADSALPSSAVSSTATFSVIEMPTAAAAEKPTSIVISHPLQQFSSLLPQNLLSHVESGMKKITLSSTNLLNYAASAPQPVLSTKDTDSINSASLLGSLQDESFFNGSQSRGSFDAGGSSGAAADTLSLQSYNSGRFSSSTTSAANQQFIECTYYFNVRGRRLNRTAQQKQAAAPVYDVDNRLQWHVRQQMCSGASSIGGKLTISLENSSATTSTLFSDLLVPFRIKITNETNEPLRYTDSAVPCLVFMHQNAVIFSKAQQTNVLYTVTTPSADARRQNKVQILSLLQIAPRVAAAHGVDNGEVFLAPHESVQVAILVKMHANEKISALNLSVVAGDVAGAASSSKLDSGSYEVLVADAMHDNRIAIDDNRRGSAVEVLEYADNKTDDAATDCHDRLQVMLVYYHEQQRLPVDESGAHRRVLSRQLAECGRLLTYRPFMDCQVMCMKLSGIEAAPSGSLLLYIKIAHLQTGFSVRLRNFGCCDYSKKLSASLAIMSSSHSHTAASPLQIFDRLTSFRLSPLPDDQLMASVQVVDHPKVAYFVLLAVPESTESAKSSLPLFFPPGKLIASSTHSGNPQQHQQNTKSPYAKARAGKRPSRAAVKRQESNVAAAAAAAVAESTVALQFRLLWQMLPLNSNAELVARKEEIVPNEELFRMNSDLISETEDKSVSDIGIGESVVLISETNRWFSF